LHRILFARGTQARWRAERHVVGTRAAAVVLSALALLAGLAAPAAAQEGTGRITGVVRDDTGAVAGSTCVSARPSSGSHSEDPARYRSATADAAGRYAVDVPAGSYALSVGSCTSDGPYARVFRGGGDRAVDSPPVVVDAATSAAVDLVTPRSATVSGRVMYDDGAPASRRCLSVQVSAAPDLVQRVLTADDGTYTVRAVAAGLQRVHFGDCEGDGASYGSWYAGGRAYDEATPIEVAPGAAITGIDGTLRRYATMTGRVVDETGAPVVGACAGLQSVSGGFNGFRGCTDSDGRWRIEQLRPSAYKVFISRGAPHNADLVERYYPASPDSSTAVPVVVVEGVDVPSVDVVLPHGGRVRGRVTSTDGTPLVGACVSARGLSYSSNSATTAADGTYLIRGVDVGAYHVRVSRCSAGNWAPTWYGSSGDRQPTTEGLQISLGQDITGIDVALEPGAVVTGRLVDSAGLPVAGICTTAFHGGGTQEGARTDAQGVYRLEGLPTSRDYYLIWRDCVGGRYAQEFSGGTAFEATATRLATTAGRTTQVPDNVLELAGSVSGTVTDARTGLRVGQVGVTLVDPASGQSAVYAFTDGNGSYTVRGVKPGQWAVRFYDGGANVAVPEYWDDSLTLGGATPVTVAEAVDRAGVDAAVLLLTVPSVPRLPEVLPAPEAAVVTWDPPLDDGSAAIERYDVVDPAGTVVATVPGTMEEARVEGLAAGRTYAFAVRAANRKGPGPATAPLEVTPRAADPSSSSSPRPTTSPTSSPTRPPSTSPSSPGPSPGPAGPAPSGPAPSSPAPSGPAPSPSPSAGPAPGQPFAPLAPSRVLDTRDGTGGMSGRLAPGVPVTLRVTGEGGVPSSGVRAVVLNTTVTGASGSGHLTVYPGGTSAPAASNLNFTRGATVPNLVTVPVAADGTVRLLANAGSPHVLADVVGWYGPAATLRFGPLAPERVLDTRDGTGGVSGRLAPGQAVRTVLAGRGGVPAAGARAVVLNVTVTGASGGGHLTAYPGGTAPLASNLNYARGQTVANLVVVPLDDDGAVSLRANAGSPHVIADAVGWFGADARGLHTALRPARLFDTREAPGGRLQPGESRGLGVLGRGGVPVGGVRAVVLNVTATGASAPGHLAVHPAEVPRASSLNYVQAQTVANLVVVPVGPDGAVRFTSNAGSPHVVVDVVGWFGG
jgi:hypothetical protein